MATAQSSTNTIRLKWIVTGTRWLSILLILASLLLILRALPIGQVMEAMKGWIGGLGIWGPVVLALVYVVATVLFVPGTILTVEMQEAYAENASGPAFNHSAFGSLLHQHLAAELNTNSLDSQKWSTT